MCPNLSDPRTPICHLRGKRRRKVPMTRAAATMYGECVACPAARATGPNATPAPWNPGLSAHSPGLALPLAEHRLDRVVHLGVLVILGGHQELLNSPKKRTSVRGCEGLTVLLTLVQHGPK